MNQTDCQYTGVMISLGYCIGDFLIIPCYDNDHFVVIHRYAVIEIFRKNTVYAVITERFYFLDYVVCSRADSDYSETHREGLLVFLKNF